MVARRGGSSPWNVVLAAVATTGRDVFPTSLALLTLLMSGISIVFYAYDKMAAILGAFRISEVFLHAISIAGGWPGAALAQQVFRHKCSKAAFQEIFMATIIGSLFLVGSVAKAFDFSFTLYFWSNNDGSLKSRDNYQNDPLQQPGEL